MKNLYKSLAAFQQEVPAIHEGTKGHHYTYSDLKTIFKVINPILKKNGLGFTQLLENETIKTIIFHIESGETIESSTSIPQGVKLGSMNTFQVLGSAITYYRRYSLSAALGLVTDVDSDATGEDPKQPTKITLEDPKHLPKITSEAYQKAIKAISDKKVTLDQIKAKYNLSEDQEKTLKSL